MEKLFRHEDWTLFRTLTGLSQKAGVSRQQLPMVLVKELVDNALDASETCDFDLLDENGFFVEDDGPGFTWQNRTATFDVTGDGGRGLALMHMYSSEMTFNDRGNRVELRRCFEVNAPAAPA